MNVFFKIRQVDTGFYYKPKWGETGFHKHGKVYAQPGHAKAAWKNTDQSTRSAAGDVELVAFEVSESYQEPLK